MARYLLLLCLLSLGAQQAEQPKCVIEGVVVNELTGEGLRRAEVIARRASDRSRTGIRMGPGEPFGTGVYTDASGAFRIDNLEPGRYQLEVMKTGYLLPQNRRDTENALALGPGDVKRGLRYSLVPQAVITGRVLDEEGEPLRNVTVNAMRTRYVRGRRAWMPASSAATNDKGEYRISGLRPGRYFLAAQAREARSALFRTSEGRPTAYVTTCYPGTADHQQAQPVSVTAGIDLGGYDFRLVREPVFRISGSVLGTDGRPMANYSLLLAPAESDSGTVAGSVTREADGRFEVMGLRSGAWLISVQPVERGEGERQTGVARVEVRGSDVDDVVIRMAPRFVVGGTVELQGSGAADFTKVQVGLVASEAAPFGTSPSVAPAPDASFRVSVNAPIRYLVQAWGEPAPNAYVAQVRIGTEEYLGRELDLSQGTPGPVRIVFRADGATVLVQFQGLEENLSRQRLYAFLMPAQENLRRLGSLPMVELREGEQPRFQGVRPGDYWAFLADDPDAGTWDLASEAPDFESKAVRVKAEANGSHAVELKNVISLSGQ